MALILPTQDMTAEIVQWASEKDAVRAVLMTSTRAVPGAPRDILSDYDIILILKTLEPFVNDRSWLEDFGETLVVYWDPIYPDPQYGIDICANVTQYASGLKIDFTLWPVALFRKIAAAPELTAELDAGYRILLDKDHLTDRMRPPTYQAYIPTPPTLEEYLIHINDFLSDAPYVAKCLWRGELMPVKWALDYDMKHIYLRKMLEWRVAIEHGWSVPTGALGKGLKKQLPAAIWEQVEQSFAGSDTAENWQALEKTLAIFRQIAIEVGEDLGYPYPEALHDRVVSYLERFRAMERLSKKL